MMERTRSMRLILAMLLSLALVAGWLIFTSHPAFAQAEGKGAENFSCQDGRASGKLYDSKPTCPTTLTHRNIFSFFICNMEQLSSNLMGSMYCGMVYNLTPMVMAVLTLAVMFFGMGFTIGIIPATAREFQKFLLKVAFIYVFATQSEYLIGYGYRFLVEGAREGIAVALSNADTGSTATKTGADIYSRLDAFLGRAMQFATDYVGASWSGNSPTGDNNPCRNAIFAVLAIMAVAFPPVFFLSLLIIAKIAITFIRGVFGYVYAIVGIAFLLTLAPFFLSFFLFQHTRAYFDKWLGYLVSFALQMVIVFAFLTFVVTIDVKNLSASIVNIIMPVQESPEGTTARFNWRYCTVCDFEVIRRDASTGAITVIAQDDYENFLGQGELRCKTPLRPIRALSAVTPDKSTGDAPNRAIQGALLQFVGGALLSLLILAYMIDGILSFIPYLAQKLAGGLAPYAPQLGGGYSPSAFTVADVPGMGTYERGTGYSGVFGSFERGFYQGFTNTPGNSISRAVAGLGRGVTTAVSGTRDAAGNTTELDPGLRGRFVRFLTGPLGDSRDA